MAAWRYEISLLVLKNISRVKYFLALEEEFLISTRPSNILYFSSSSNKILAIKLSESNLWETVCNALRKESRQ